MSPSLTVVVCSLNGAARIGGCLRALDAQTIRPDLEVIVVDDGSTDGTDDAAQAFGVTVIRHATNRGVSAARNSGIAIASAPIVAFLDDDCEPHPDWAQRMVEGYTPDVMALGGALVVPDGSGFILPYLARHNPLEPLELELAKSDRMPYRLLLYVQKQWIAHPRSDRREVFSIASANISVRREFLLAVGGFDERVRFGGEDEDLCRRLRLAFPDRKLAFDPSTQATHHFEPTLRDTLRRSRAYGAGSALIYRKWPAARPTIYPVPLIVLALLALSPLIPVLALAALALPYLAYPKAVPATIARRDLRCLLDPYVQVAQEAFDDLGFLEGLWKFRHFPAELSSPSASPQRTMSGPQALVEQAHISIAPPSDVPNPHRELPSMSVVVCAFNSQRVIARALESLVAQDYPPERFEIIVVDDGSRDQTAEIASRYPVTVVRHGSNRGLASARNTGLAHAQGSVYVSFDDDCTVESDWLRNLAWGYQNISAAGIGSVVHEPVDHRGLASRFMAGSGKSNSPSLMIGASRNPLARYISYVGDQFFARRFKTDIVCVHELNGASASFPTDVLRAVGGWDPSLRAVEDLELCDRIRARFPEQGFYTVTAAQITHDPGMTLIHLLRRSYGRSLDTLRYYNRKQLAPPIFPYPIVWLAVVIVVGFLVGPLAAALAAILLPQLAYLWWPVRTVQDRSLWPLILAYVQLAEESATLVGLGRAKAVLLMAGWRSSTSPDGNG